MKVTITEDDVRGALAGRSDADAILRAIRLAALERIHAEAESRQEGSLWRLEAVRNARLRGQAGLNELRDAEETHRQRENAANHAWAAVRAEREGRS